MSPELMPDFSPYEISVILSAAAKREEQIAYRQAVLSSFAYHQPDKIPAPGDSNRSRFDRPSDLAAEAEAVSAKATMRAWAARSSGKA